MPFEDKLISINQIYDLSDFNLEELVSELEIIEESKYHRIYGSDGIKIGFGESGRYYILTKPTFMNDRGITIGSTRLEVQNAYGRLGLDTDRTWTTFNHNAEQWGTRFTFKNDKVIEIYANF